MDTTGADPTSDAKGVDSINTAGAEDSISAVVAKNYSSKPAPLLEVSPAEAGLKLLRFLQRRLMDDPPPALLHKWVRSGQVRVNGGRSAPFVRLVRGDHVRLPPFARPRETWDPPLSSPTQAESNPALSGLALSAPSLSSPGECLGPGLVLLDIYDDILVLGKSAGLSCHQGSTARQSQTREKQNAGPAPALSVAEILAQTFADAPYIPAPAHRLDRRSSGLLLAALSHAQATRLHHLFAEGGIHKYYLAWVFGRPSWEGARLLEDNLDKSLLSGRELMRVLPEAKAEPYPAGEAGKITDKKKAQGIKSDGKTAHCAALVLHRLEAGQAPPGFPVPAALLMLRLLSGRKHQLRVQLAARGLPVIGDALHGRVLNGQGEMQKNGRGGRQKRRDGEGLLLPHFPELLLHAHFLSLPERTSDESGNLRPDQDLRPRGRAQAKPTPNITRREFILPPSWPSDLVLDEKTLAGARTALDACIAANFLNATA